DPDLFSENPNFTNIMTKLILNLIDKDKIVEYRDNSMEPFLVTQKFEVEEPIMIGWSNLIPYLNAFVLSDNNVDSGSEDKIEIDNKRLNSSKLMNPHKCKGKSRLKRTDRIRRADEPSKKTKCKLHYKICR
ncbi:607_t:CDS:2, partial [Scutellospora calospora]